MPRRAYLLDAGLAARMAVVIVLIAALWVAIGVFAWKIGHDYPIIYLALAVAPILSIVGGDWLMLNTAGARMLERRKEPHLHAALDRLAALADMPPPRIAIMRSPVPNAFATGWRRSRAVVVLTTGLRRRLDRDEVEAVMAHELTHVANRDVVVMTSAGFVQIVGSGIVRWIPLALPIGVVIYTLGRLLTLTLSRYREYAADRGAALLTGRPETLMSALAKIAGGVDAIPKRDLRGLAGMSSFFIVSTRPSPYWFEFLPDHPPLERRLAALGEIARTMAEARA